jgi:hypothetical protein
VGTMSTRRVIAAVVLVVMVALIVIGVATKDHKLILVALVVGAVPAFAGTTSGFRSAQQDERTRPIEGIHGRPLVPDDQAEQSRPDRAAAAEWLKRRRRRRA